MNSKDLIKSIRFKGMTAEEKIQAIRHLSKKGMSAYQIALKFQVTPQSIYYWIAKDDTK